MAATVLLFNFPGVALREINSTFGSTSYLTLYWSIKSYRTSPASFFFFFPWDILIKEGFLFWFYTFIMSRIFDRINQMMRVSCAGYGGVYLMRFDLYWSSAPLRFLLMYKIVEDNSYFLRESSKSLLALPLQGWLWLYTAALCSAPLISSPVALKLVLIWCCRNDFFFFFSAQRKNTIQMRGRCLNALSLSGSFVCVKGPLFTVTMTAKKEKRICPVMHQDPSF